ncbi:MAG: hypothetical protein MUD01_24075 [Chloroflexaceae bacterium]|nr:hypothetical protein [Chloroflexaceae bacterium]
MNQAVGLEFAGEAEGGHCAALYLAPGVVAGAAQGSPAIIGGLADGAEGVAEVPAARADAAAGGVSL